MSAPIGNRLKSLNNPAVQGVVAVSDAEMTGDSAHIAIVLDKPLPK
jgi:hypothetical protein